MEQGSSIFLAKKIRNGVVLDLLVGTASTGISALRNGFDFLKHIQYIRKIHRFSISKLISPLPTSCPDSQRKSFVKSH